MLDRRVGIDGESGARPERFADLLPLRARQEERLEPAEVLRAVYGEVPGLDLVAHLEEQRAFPAAAVEHAVATDERLQRRRCEVERCVGRQAAAPRPAIYFYDTEGNPIAAESVVDVMSDREIQEDGGLTVQTEMEPLGQLTISTHGRGV